MRCGRKDHAAGAQPLDEFEAELAGGYANDRDW
jgi:hypothetical protein